MRHEYSPLLTRPTLLGLPDERRLVPLLLAARSKGWSERYPDRLLDELGVGRIHQHPGYQLIVQTLGAFRVWRGENPILNNEWKREKARQLLQVLIANRAAPLDRDQICECLWPELDPESSHRNFKVALSTLYQVLEPDRKAGSDSTYVVREGSTYALRPYADLSIDVINMEKALSQAEALYPADPAAARACIRSALDLYQGEFLPDALYEIWSAAERERVRTLYLRNCDRLCEWSLASDPDDVIAICQKVLAIDNCWERAYRFMMQAYANLGDHGQVARTFQTCLDVLRSELDVAPASQTFELYRSLIDSHD
jgi:DNA-binding SARP family transcriptional activator